jgi:hypothetical protein
VGLLLPHLLFRQMPLSQSRATVQLPSNSVGYAVGIGVGKFVGFGVGLSVGPVTHLLLRQKPLMHDSFCEHDSPRPALQTLPLEPSARHWFDRHAASSVHDPPLTMAHPVGDAVHASHAVSLK